MRAILIIVMCIFIGSCDRRQELSELEIAYVKQNVVHYLVENNYPPYMFIDTATGEPAGLSKDYMDKISKVSGLRFVPARNCQLAECLEIMKRSDGQIITSVRPAPARSVFMHFSRPYLNIDTLLVRRTNEPKTVGVGRGYSIKDYLMRTYTNLSIVEFDNDEHAMNALIKGDIDSAALDVGSNAMLKEKYKYKFHEEILPFEYHLSFGLPLDDFILKSILDKSISRIND